MPAKNECIRHLCDSKIYSSNELNKGLLAMKKQIISEGNPNFEDDERYKKLAHCKTNIDGDFYDKKRCAGLKSTKRDNAEYTQDMHRRAKEMVREANERKAEKDAAKPPSKAAEKKRKEIEIATKAADEAFEQMLKAKAANDTKAYDKASKAHTKAMNVLARGATFAPLYSDVEKEREKAKQKEQRDYEKALEELAAYERMRKALEEKKQKAEEKEKEKKQKAEEKEKEKKQKADEKAQAKTQKNPSTTKKTTKRCPNGTRKNKITGECEKIDGKTQSAGRKRKASRRKSTRKKTRRP
jgi:hypothetical protein